MLDAPRHDWDFYATRVAAANVADPVLSPTDKLTIYEDLFGLVVGGRRQQEDWRRVEEWAWGRKLAGRIREAAAYARLDEIRHARSAANNPV